MDAETLSAIVVAHGRWLAHRGGCRADLREANLRGASLEHTDLREARLEHANLSAARLEHANLGEAHLEGADLRWARLEHASLRWARLEHANLRWARLEHADMREARLDGADLVGASLEYADLREARLADTCLDPAAQTPPVDDATIIAAGLEIDGEWVLGWRTATSRVVGDQTYEPGQTYVAPVFSVSPTDCHPGIYLAGRDWLEREYPGAPLVRVRTRRSDLHHPVDKWRTRRLGVLL